MFHTKLLIFFNENIPPELRRNKIINYKTFFLFFLQTWKKYWDFKLKKIFNIKIPIFFSLLGQIQTSAFDIKCLCYQRPTYFSELFWQTLAVQPAKSSSAHVASLVDNVFYVKIRWVPQMSHFFISLCLRLTREVRKICPFLYSNGHTEAKKIPEKLIYWCR